MSQKSGTHFTEKQGHYLAFIYTYAHMFGRPPAETDMQRHFRVSPPSVHQMIVTLRTKRFHSPSARRSPKHRDALATRKPAHPRMARYQNVKITVMNH
ncbi:SOS response transcriptional repressor [Bradyrhizobium sp. SUTN9-2]|uniref:SOS response transcriptional repressor n=1 Tax=Bradyrhizobium sp. SUTN9-2 TaxID=1167456 RepID=UPI0032E507A3